MTDLPLLFAGPIGGTGGSTNWAAVYTFASIFALITALLIYSTRVIPYQLAHRKQMLLARWLAPLVGLLFGFFGYVYNDQTKYLITVPVFLTCVLENLISLWIWHEVNIYMGRHKKIFSRRINKALVVLGCMAMVGFFILGILMHINNEEGLRRTMYRRCLREFEGYQGRAHGKYYAYKKTLSASNLDYEDLERDAIPRCGQDPRLTELWSRLKLRRE